MKVKLKKREGYLLLEAIVALAIFAVLFANILPWFGALVKRQGRAKVDSKAPLVLQEGMEVAYNVLLSGWDEYNDTDRYDVGLNGGVWELVDWAAPVDGKYTREITFKHVCRLGDGNPRIRHEGNCTPDMTNNYDPKVKKVIVDVSWTDTDHKPQSLHEELYVYLFE